MRAIRISRWGGPTSSRSSTTRRFPSRPSTSSVCVSRAGVNFADTHARDNSYLAPYELPLIPGAEVAGTTEDGRHVVAMLATGGYAEYAAVPKATAFDIPDGVSDAAALALLIQGLTAWHLYRTSAHVVAGESVVVHAAAGGVGSLAVQLGKAFGAYVIATASTEESARWRSSGRRRGRRRHPRGPDRRADRRQRRPARRRRARDGRRPRVRRVAERAGAFGRLVTYGMASREPTWVAAGTLLRHSSAVIGFWLAHGFARPRRCSPRRCATCSTAWRAGTCASSRARCTRSPTPGGARGSPGPSHHRQAAARPGVLKSLLQ